MLLVPVPFPWIVYSMFNVYFLLLMYLLLNGLEFYKMGAWNFRQMLPYTFASFYVSYGTLVVTDGVFWRRFCGIQIVIWNETRTVTWCITCMRSSFVTSGWCATPTCSVQPLRMSAHISAVPRTLHVSQQLLHHWNFLKIISSSQPGCPFVCKLVSGCRGLRKQTRTAVRVSWLGKDFMFFTLFYLRPCMHVK